MTIIGGHAVLLQLQPVELVDAAVRVWVDENRLRRSLAKRPWHLTLAHVGRDLSERAADLVMNVARQVGDALPGRIVLTGDTAVFAGGDHLVARVELSPVLGVLRRELVVRLEAAGIAVSGNYGFNPHVTLAVGRGPLIHFERTVAEVDDIIVKRGEQYLCFGRVD